MLDNKIVNSVQNQLNYTAFSLEKELKSLNHVAMQLSFEQEVGKDLSRYLASDYYDRFQLEQEIKNYIFLITYTNPNIGLIHYYFSDTKQSVFTDTGISLDLHPDELPKLYSFGGISYHALHPSIDILSDSLVLSVDRRIFIPGYDNLHIYVETSPKLLSQLLGDNQSGMTTAYLMSDTQNRIVYSENVVEFTFGSILSPENSGLPFRKTQNSYLFSEKSSEGWGWTAVIPKVEYDKEKNSWIRQFALIATVTLMAALGFAWMLWRTVYKPLTGFNKEIRLFQVGSLHSPLNYPKIAEFDYVLDRFEEMRQRIRQLLLEVEQNEKMKSRLEVEKLLFQINPHFIHNTLDTVRWLARLNGQEQIERLVSLLNKVLYYNMGKGGTATLGREIACLNDYVALQQIRYDFKFEVDIQAGDELLNVPIPRFILQPLVENSLYHGIGDNGLIIVKAGFQGEDRIRIEVKDSGLGMDVEEIRRVLDSSTEERRKTGMGIGIHYVNRIIKVQYGDRASLTIRSEPGIGTSIVLLIPIIDEPEGA
ncbi:sensor histidine kinase [Paenibacillus mesophilus]|uniref:sensor histidine kinase n=1 Tax=Paenibacillus mesophilus TaxID=2582849 RepID=UPI0013052CC2|nr:histidine kinase [Paenibacillus mesophilus]